jgi:O-antigen/teichoic acid export membrane protein
VVVFVVVDSGRQGPSRVPVEAFPRAFRWFASLLPDEVSRRRLTSGAGWTFLGRFAANGFGLVTGIVLARLLGASGFGQLGLVQSFVAAVGVFAGLGLGLTATRAVAELRASAPERAAAVAAMCGRTALVSGLVVSVAALLVARLVAVGYLGSEQLTVPMVLSAPLPLLGAVNGVQVGLLCGLEAFAALATGAVAVAVTTLVFCGIGAHIAGVPGAVVGYVGAAVVSVALHQVLVVRARHDAGLDLAVGQMPFEWRWIFGFSVPVLLSSSVVAPVMWLGNSMLVRQTGGFSELGLFTAAGQWRTALLLFPNAVAGVALPVLANLVGGRRADEYRKVFRTTMLVSVAGTAVAAAVLIGAGSIVGAFYGSGFAALAPVLTFIAVAGVLTAGNDIIGHMVATKGSMWWAFLFNALWGAAFLVFAWMLVPRAGARGLAAALALAYVAHTLWQGTYALRIDRPGKKPPV